MYDFIVCWRKMTKKSARARYGENENESLVEINLKISGHGIFSGIKICSIVNRKKEKKKTKWRKNWKKENMMMNNAHIPTDLILDTNRRNRIEKDSSEKNNTTQTEKTNSINPSTSYRQDLFLGLLKRWCSSRMYCTHSH